MLSCIKTTNNKAERLMHLVSLIYLNEVLHVFEALNLT